MYMREEGGNIPGSAEPSKSLPMSSSVSAACTVSRATRGRQRNPGKLFDGSADQLFASLLGRKKLSAVQIERLREMVKEME